MQILIPYSKGVLRYVMPKRKLFLKRNNLFVNRLCISLDWKYFIKYLPIYSTVLFVEIVSFDLHLCRVYDMKSNYSKSHIEIFQRHSESEQVFSLVFIAKICHWFIYWPIWTRQQQKVKIYIKIYTAREIWKVLRY